MTRLRRASRRRRVVEEARANAGIARSEFFPQIQGTAGWSRSLQSEFAVSGHPDHQTSTTSTSASPGRSISGAASGRLNEAALARYLATEEARRGVLLSLVSDVATRYFQLRALDFELEIARRTTDVVPRDPRSRSDRRSKKRGLASPLEILERRRLARHDARRRFPELERRIAEQENLIAFLLGREPG